MKNTLFLSLVLLLASIGLFSATMPLNLTEKNAPKAKLENTFFDEHKMNMSLEEIASLTPKKFQEITGKKLTLKETIAFKMAQKQLKLKNLKQKKSE